MPRNYLNRLISLPQRRTTNNHLVGTIVSVSGREANVKMPDGSVIKMPISIDSSLLGVGSIVNVQWRTDSSPFVVSGGGDGVFGKSAINRLTIPSGEHTEVGELDYLLPDAYAIGLAMASTLLNQQFSGIAMPSMSFYAGLMLSYTNSTTYTEITATYFSNYKRAVVPRNTLMWPLVSSGETITNAIAIGIDTPGKPNSFLGSGAGSVLPTLPSIQIDGVGLFNAQTGGSLWVGNKFLTPLTLKNGDVPGIQAGKLAIGFANQRLTQFEKRNFLNVGFNSMGYTRPSYSIRLLTGEWKEPTTAQWPNYKPAVVYRDSTTFPPTTTKSIKNGIIIGNGAGGTANSFFSSGNMAYIPGGALLVNAIGVYDHQNNACWRVPLANNEAATIKNGDPVFIDIGKLIFKIS